MLRALFHRWPIWAALACLGGCGQSSEYKSASAPNLPTAAGVEASRENSNLAGELPPAMARFAGQEQALPAKGGDATSLRKIISKARIELVVEDFDGIPERVAALAAQAGGFVADSTISGTSGENRHGTWKLRVPSARLDELVSATQRLGELVSAGTESQDVSEAYYDVDARIRNKTKEEERLLKLLDDRPGKLEEILNIERELARVRDEVERMQGRMRVLNDLTTLSTVQISISEIHGYIPPEAPTFATRLRRALVGSTDSLRATAEWSLITVATVLPWLALGGGLALIYAALRRRRRRKTPAYHGSV